MRVRLLHSLTILRSDAAGEEQFQAGQTYEVTRLLGASLVTEGWAVEEASGAEAPAAESDSPRTVVSSDVQPSPNLAASDDEQSTRRS